MSHKAAVSVCCKWSDLESGEREFGWYHLPKFMGARERKYVGRVDWAAGGVVIFDPQAA